MKRQAAQLLRLRQLRRDAAQTALLHAQAVYENAQRIEDERIRALKAEVQRQFDELRRTDQMLCAGVIGGSALAEARSRHRLILERLLDDRYAACHLAAESWVEMRMKASRLARAERALNQSLWMVEQVRDQERLRARQVEELVDEDWSTAAIGRARRAAVA